MEHITISEVNKKNLRIIGFLVGSGLLGYVLATYVAKDPMLTAVFGPAINYGSYWIWEELKKEGYVQAVRNSIIK